MDYNETTQWLFRQLPMYQKQGASAYRKDLVNTIRLAEHLGNPEKHLKLIHIAGTNGKGSTSHMLASILQTAGYRTGLYTSPHLKDFRERIKIDGVEVSENFVIEFTSRNKSFFEAHDLSFFEMTVGMAFEYFREQEVDIAVIETGLGGRLDATNIITPLVSVITNISFDHTQFLGNTLAGIAAEKAGIIKNGIPVVVGEYNDQTKPVFIRKASVCNSEIYFASEMVTTAYTSDLGGDYQIHNIKTVMAIVDVLKLRGLHISDVQLRQGLVNVVLNTGFAGRWQQLGKNPAVICDTAHNPAGLELVMNQLRNQKYERLHIVAGFVNDKDLAEILPLFPTDAIYYFCRPDIPRGLDAYELQQKAALYSIRGNCYESVKQAFNAAKAAASSNDLIYLGGSTFVVAEVL